MAKRILYHGTTAENWENIKEHGFSSPVITWECSDDEMTYFYDFLKHQEAMGNEEEELDSRQTISTCFEQASITASVNKYLRTDLVVIEVEMDDEFIEGDDSCYNKESNGAVQVENRDLNMYGKITNVFTTDDYQPYMSGLYIMGFVNNNNGIDLNLDKWSGREIDFLEKMAESEFYMEELFDFDF